MLKISYMGRSSCVCYWLNSKLRFNVLRLIQRTLSVRWDWTASNYCTERNEEYETFRKSQLISSDIPKLAFKKCETKKILPGDVPNGGLWVQLFDGSQSWHDFGRCNDINELGIKKHKLRYDIKLRVTGSRLYETLNWLVHCHSNAVTRVQHGNGFENILKATRTIPTVLWLFACVVAVQWMLILCEHVKCSCSL